MGFDVQPLKDSVVLFLMLDSLTFLLSRSIFCDLRFERRQVLVLVQGQSVAHYFLSSVLEN